MDFYDSYYKYEKIQFFNIIDNDSTFSYFMYQCRKM